MIFSENLSLFLKDYGFISGQDLVKNQLANFDLDSVNIDGDPPLIVAARWNRPDIVLELLNKGANINMRDKRSGPNGGATALHRAVQFVRQEPVNHLEPGQYVNDIQRALHARENEQVEKEAIEIVDCLIESGIHLDIQDNQGATALFRAVQNNRVLIVDRLLAAGANFNMGVNNGTTPIFAAIYGNAPLILQLLLNKGAETEQKLMGLTPAVVASILMHKGDIQYGILAVLINAGADLTAVDNHGNTVFDYIYQSNYQDFCLFTINLIIDHLRRTLSRCQRHCFTIDSIEAALYSAADKYSNLEEGRRLTRMISDKLLNQLRLERAPGCQAGIQPCPGGAKSPQGARSFSLESDDGLPHFQVEPYPDEEEVSTFNPESVEISSLKI